MQQIFDNFSFWQMPLSVFSGDVISILAGSLALSLTLGLFVYLLRIL